MTVEYKLSLKDLLSTLLQKYWAASEEPIASVNFKLQSQDPAINIALDSTVDLSAIEATIVVNTAQTFSCLQAVGPVDEVEEGPPVEEGECDEDDWDWDDDDDADDDNNNNDEDSKITGE